MFQQLVRHGSFKNIAVGTISGEIPAVGKHHAIILEVLKTGSPVSVANILGALSNLIVRVDGVPKIEADPEFIEMRNKFWATAKAFASTAGYIVIPLSDPNLVSDSERRMMGWGMSGVGSFTVEATCGTVANIDQINIYTLFTPENAPLGAHMTLQKNQRSFGTLGVALAATTEQELTDLPDKGNQRIKHKAIHIGIPYSAGNQAALAYVELEVNGVRVYRQVAPALSGLLQGRRGLTRMAASIVSNHTTYETIDLDLENDLSGGLPMGIVKDYKLRLGWTTGSPGAYPIYIEKVEC